jgi:hypothetical protein
MPDFIVASTTATQEEVDHAVSENWRERVPDPEIKPEVKPEVSAEVEESETPVAAQETEKAETESATEAETTQEKPKGKGGFQKKIDKLTRERSEATERADNLERELSEFRAKFDAIEQRLAPKAETQQEKPKTEAIAGKPLESEIGTKFKDWPEYNEALIDWKAEEKIQARLDERDKNAQERELENYREEIGNEYRKNLDEFRKATPDFDAAVDRAAKAGMQLPVPIIDRIRALSNGPDVTYHLVNNPEEALALIQAEPSEGFVMLGILSASLKPSEPPKPAPAKKVVSTAPPAHKPVTGASARGAVTLEDLSKQGTDDYIRARKVQIAQRDKARYS